MQAALRVLRIYHGGRDPQHRGRDRALARMGIDLTLVVPDAWPEFGAERELSHEAFRILELPVRRAGQVNQHAYRDLERLTDLLLETRPDVLDIHEEPVSVAARQWIASAASAIPVVMYTAQNIDKRYPPPFSRFERDAYRRVTALYPCSNQAASVARGKGFAGAIEVLPLGYDDEVFFEGSQSVDSDEIVLMFAGRFVAEKGAADAVRVLAHVRTQRSARLVLVGNGPENTEVRKLGEALGMTKYVEYRPWLSGPDLASAYRQAHAVLVPSRPTPRWVEQFGRVIIEAQASGAIVAGYANGSIPEVVGDAGIITPTGDVKRLGEEILRIISNREAFRGLRNAGLLRASRFTWPAVASQQFELYRRAQFGNEANRVLPRSPRRRREIARREFGDTAVAIGGARPFALPLLRNGGYAARSLASIIDSAKEVW